MKHSLLIYLFIMVLVTNMEATSSPWGGFIALLFGIVAAWFGWGLFPVAAVCCLVAFVCEIL